VIKRNCFIAQAHGYSSAREAALDPDAIPTAVYDNLIATVRQQLPRFHRFVRLRQRILGVERLYLADLSVPLTSAPPPPVTYDEARELVLAALSPLGPEYVGTLRRGLFDEGWVDVYETPHKRSGAYSWGAFGTKPFVLLNWQDTLSNVYTLAYEVGHSMHTFYTFQSQPYITSNYTTFVAEVASTCNEALLSAYLLRTLTNPEQRRAVLSQQLLVITGTLFWQTLFAEFEHAIHARAEQGAGLTAADFSSIYAQLFAEYFGPDVVVDETASLVWAQVPHFYFNFYVYKYATGIAAALALASQILTEGQPAVDRYLAFLRSGASQQSLALLQQAGVDMTTPQPIEQTLAVFDSLVDQLEAIVESIRTIEPALED
jgi:oligoendopeptidase F